MTTLQAALFMFGAFVPAIVWMAFFLREDEHPEPARLLAKTFFFGMLSSAPTLLAQTWLQRALGDASGVALGTLVAFAAVEEIFKYFAAFGAVRGDPDFDEPIDAMIYLLVAGLGFATVENLFIMGSFVGNPAPANMLAAGQTLLLRVGGATLLHVLACAVTGYFWALGVLKGKVARHLVLGVALATLMHAAFNYLVQRYQSVNLMYPSVFLVGAAFFVFADFEKLKKIEDDMERAASTEPAEGAGTGGNGGAGTVL